MRLLTHSSLSRSPHSHCPVWGLVTAGLQRSWFSALSVVSASMSCMSSLCVCCVCCDGHDCQEAHHSMRHLHSSTDVREQNVLFVNYDFTEVNMAILKDALKSSF